MEFNNFVESIISQIKGYLPNKYSDATINVSKIRKNNNLELIGLNILLPDENIVPCIYLEEFYEDFILGESNLDDVLREISDIRTKNESLPCKNINLSKLTNFNLIKDDVCFKAVGTENNQELLHNIPNRVENDIALIYYINLSNPNDTSIGSVQITNDMIKSMNITEEELYNVSLENMLSRFAPKLRSMENVIGEMMPGILVGPLIMPTKMYILSNEQGLFGAATLFYPDIKEILALSLKNNYYVIPSSIHEVIIIPYNKEIDTIDLQLIVQDVNATEVLQEEVLTNNVYFYDSETKEFSIVNDDRDKSDIDYD